MKKTMILTAIFFGMFLTSLNAHSNYYSDINVNYFYGALEPYGEWIDIGYDDYVWRPYKSDYNWKPYTEGRWEWTRHGWYWVSYEPFGWATFHYGRWYFDDYYGWVWMPDNVWAPAWVEWRYNDTYIGWAPLPPYARYNHGHGIYFSISWHSGFTYWNFVNYKHFVSSDIHHHCVERNYVKNIYNKTKYRTNYFEDKDRLVNGGISRKYVESRIGRKLSTREISRTNNYNEYNSNDIRKRSNIVDFKPSEAAIKNSTFDSRNVKKGNTLKSLDSEKIVINRRNTEIEKNVNREKSVDDKILRKSDNSGKNDNKIEKNVPRTETKDSREIKRNIEKPVNKTSPSTSKKEVEKSSGNYEIKKKSELKRDVINKNKVETRGSTKNVEKKSTVTDSKPIVKKDTERSVEKKTSSKTEEKTRTRK
jgi:hypothetical protein